MYRHSSLLCRYKSDHHHVEIIGRCACRCQCHIKWPITKNTSTS